MSRVQPSTLSLEQMQQLAADITQVLSLYGFITDSYIIEFFTDRLWETLPVSWRGALSNLSSSQIADQLLCNTTDVCYRSVWPLSLLALKVTAHALRFPRNPRSEARKVTSKKPQEFLENHCQSSLLDPLFRKHVKPKKQHEIRQLGKLVKKLSDVTVCDQVVDIGSGQGHLSRFLSFGQGLSVTAVEADEHLVTMARKFDQHLMYMLYKEAQRLVKSDASDPSKIIPANPPKHVLAWVNPKASWEELLMNLDDRVSVVEDKGDRREPTCHAADLENNSPLIKGENEQTEEFSRRRIDTTDSSFTAGGDAGCDVFGSERKGSDSSVKSASYSHHTVNNPQPCGLSHCKNLVLTGLHACGDLSVAMLRHFVRCPNVVGITSVACCYMKLSTEEVPDPPGVLFPSQSHDKMHTEYGYPLSSWVAQLQGHKLSYKAREVACHAIEDYIERLRTDCSILRIHSYRAVLETVIRSIDPTMKRAGVQTIKKAYELTFTEYAQRGLERVGLNPQTPICEESVQDMLAQQQNVVAFFSLALLLAPLVETLILLDRMIFVRQEGFHCDLIALFKPHFSPRNLVLVAAKADTLPGELLQDIQSIL
uniref:Methyltransferase like 25B n=1 Tax=Leptobrachium leishanense TaxID=445787 RepID=A0A8C5R125_9ANUR